MPYSATKNVKVIFDPLWGIIDITDYLPLVDTPAFQALGFKYQLGVTSLLFPSATHTRKQHSFGAFRRTQDLAERWMNRGFITQRESRLIIAFALLHDIGHGPFSHVLEEVTREIYARDHDQNGAILIDQLRDTVFGMGIDFTELKKLFTHENPLYLAVHDKNLGTEKLDYLARDSYYTLGEIPGVEYLAHHTYFIQQKLVIDEKAIDQAKAIQEFYVKMYKNVYLRKNSAIASRLVQKMVAKLLNSSPMPENEFWALTDFGLLGLIETSESSVVRELYKKFIHRDLPKTAIALRHEKFAAIDHRQDKAQTALGIPEEKIQYLATSEITKPSTLNKVERHIEKMANLPELSVTVVSPTSMARFVSQDINIYTGGRNISKLSGYFADHFEALREEGRSYIVMRICTYDEYRKTLSDPVIAEEIKNYILSL